MFCLIVVLPQLCGRPNRFNRIPYLHSVVEDLVFVFLDAEDVLEHVVELLLGENHLGRGGRLALRPLAWVVVAAKDLIELGHPRAEHRLLAQSVDLRQTPDSLFDVVLEHLQPRDQ